MTTGLTNEWKKSSRSGGNGGACVEVRLSGEGVEIRDSKALGSGPVLTVDATAWRHFVSAAASGGGGTAR